jgi:tetratricopeptide (TPR) repeat protein
MPGLGALGVTFGYVIAMDSPSGRPPGSFHWGSTLWHEMSHVFVLELSDHKAPRWISEGIAVYEESIAAEGWGDRLTPDVIRAIKEKKLLPVAELDRGFVRPRYRSQVPVSYYQAGMICELIAKEWGFPKLIAMVRAYAGGKTTEQVFRQELGVSPEEFDSRFEKFLNSKTEKQVAAFDPVWRRTMETVLKLAKDKKWADVIDPARRASDLYPEYTEGGNAYEILAEALENTGDKEGAARALERYRLNGGRNPRSLKKLASLHEALGRPDKARYVLEQLVWIRPGDEELHSRLGEMHLAAKQPQRALREFSALLALQPLDPAAAHYNLARTYHQLQQKEKTREHLLAALEAAPGFRPAQKLLLEINR